MAAPPGRRARRLPRHPGRPGPEDRTGAVRPRPAARRAPRRGRRPLRRQRRRQNAPLWTDGKLKVVPSDRRASNDDESDTNITVDLSRVRQTVDPAAEWRQMYDETGRLMRDNFSAARPGRGRLEGVLGEVPAGARTGRHARRPRRPAVGGAGRTRHLARVRYPRGGWGGGDRAQGLLGADISRHEDGSWRIDRILPSETSDPHARAPLAAPGVAVRAGDAIVAVAGQPVDPVAWTRAAAVLGHRGRAGRADRLPVGRRRSAARRGRPARRRGAAALPRLGRGPGAPMSTRSRADGSAISMRPTCRRPAGPRSTATCALRWPGRGWSWTSGRTAAATPPSWSWRSSRGGSWAGTCRGDAAYSYPEDAPRGPGSSPSPTSSPARTATSSTRRSRRWGIGPVVGTRTRAGSSASTAGTGSSTAPSSPSPSTRSGWTVTGWGVENHGVDLVCRGRPDAAGPRAGRARRAARHQAIRIALAALAENPAKAAPTLPEL